MFSRLRSRFPQVVAVCLLSLAAGTLRAQTPDKAAPKLAAPITKGQRMAFASHSFHVFVPDILKEMVEAAGIKGHVRVAQSSIGGSKVVQHWDVPDKDNRVKDALRTGKVDVLSVSPVHLPDDGIEKFTALALKYNPDIRVLVQEFWLRWDIYEPTTKIPARVDHNAITGAELRKRHARLFPGHGRPRPGVEQEIRQAGHLCRPRRPGRPRPAREDHRRAGPRLEEAVGCFRRRPRAWQPGH